MENKKKVDASSSSSLDHLFGPRDSNSATSTFTTGYFGSVFPPLVVESERNQYVGTGKVGNPDNASVNDMNEISGANGKDASSIYQNETMEPSYFSSSIFYGGQENYSPKSKVSESHHNFKKEGKDNDGNGSNSSSASRGNWWKGSLYY